MYFHTKKRNIAKSFIKKTTKPKLPYLVLFLRTKTLPSKCMSSSQETLDVARQPSHDNKLLGLTPFSMLKKQLNSHRRTNLNILIRHFKETLKLEKNKMALKSAIKLAK